MGLNTKSICCGVKELGIDSALIRTTRKKLCKVARMTHYGSPFVNVACGVLADTPAITPKHPIPLNT